MNKLFIAFASIVTSGVLGYAHLKNWLALGEQTPLTAPDGKEGMFPDKDVISAESSLVFGLMFFVLCLISVFFTLQKKWLWVFIGFVGTMLTIWARIIYGGV